MKKALLLSLLWLVFPLVAPGQSANTTSDQPFTANGAFFALSVANLEASARWYSEKFALRVVMQAPKTKTVKSAVILLAGGGLLVELIQNDEAMPLSEAAHGIADPDRIHGFTKSGLIVDNFDKTLEMLRARNVSILMGPFQAHDPTGLRNFIIKDNAGNLIQFFGK